MALARVGCQLSLSYDAYVSLRDSSCLTRLSATQWCQFDLTLGAFFAVMLLHCSF